MKWVAIILLALALCWVWRNRRKLRREAGRVAVGVSKFADGGARKNQVIATSTANTPTLVDAAAGPDALPDCASSNSLCGG